MSSTIRAEQPWFHPRVTPKVKIFSLNIQKGCLTKQPYISHRDDGLTTSTTIPNHTASLFSSNNFCVSFRIQIGFFCDVRCYAEKSKRGEFRYSLDVFHASPAFQQYLQRHCVVTTSALAQQRTGTGAEWQRLLTHNFGPPPDSQNMRLV